MICTIIKSMKIRLLISLSAVLSLIGCSASGTAAAIPSDNMPPVLTTIEPLTVHFLDVGQGDCTLIIQGDHAMLIDAGPNDQEVHIRHYLDTLGIETLDYLILTHSDTDHTGSADAIQEHYDCQNIWSPDEETPYTSRQNIFSLGNASFTILSPFRYYPETNDNSLVIHLTHGENTFLFTGDAGYKAEEDMIDSNIHLQAEVLKVGHHGSSTSTSQAFLDRVDPSFAVISCGKNNDYGHPHRETLQKLMQENITVYRTDEQDTITVLSDGTSLTWNFIPTETCVSHIVNTRTGKIHLPSCENTDDMAEINKEETNLLLEQLLNMGYTACGWCLP